MRIPDASRMDLLLSQARRALTALTPGATRGTMEQDLSDPEGVALPYQGNIPVPHLTLTMSTTV